MKDFFSKQANPNLEIVTRIKHWVLEQLDATEDVMITVSELHCMEEDCPDLETVIGIFRQNRQQKFQINKPMREITQLDIAQLKLSIDHNP